MPRTLVCPKCGGAMLEGFVPSASNEAEVSPVVWIEGQPETQSGSAIEGATKFPIKTFCCRKCGFLEFYAG